MEKENAKNWTGNTKSVFSTLAANSHSKHEREKNDFYATEPLAAYELLKLEPELSDIWECACGQGHLAQVFQQANKLHYATDLIDRGYGQGWFDFLQNEYDHKGDIVTNPPYKHAKDFVEKAIKIVPIGRKVCMFLKLQFLEGKSRKDFFKQYPPKTIYVSSSRIKCALNGKFTKQSSAVAYAWFVWEKGYKGNTIVKWFN